jgi:tetratricopeptide (TPR) repeat protein
MKTKIDILGIGLLIVLVSGCAQPTIKPPEPTTNQYMVKAQEYEAKGDLVEALEQYKLVLTVDPENQAAKEKRAKIEQELRELAENHYQTGLSYHRKGQYSQARKEFLTALRYTPDHQEAKKMLREHVIGEQKVKGYVLHTIQPNESISILAKKYYGDSKKFQIIAEYNQLEDATKVKVGQKVKVPVVEGISFFAKAEDIITSSEKMPKPSPTEVVTVKSFITHTVKGGESLSKLALRYYGDYKKFPIIARYNQLNEKVGLRVGQNIKIPEIEGVSFAKKPAEKSVQTAMKPVTSAVVEEPREEEKEKGKKELEETGKEKQKEEEKELAAVDQSVNYRELGIEFFNEKAYAAAISEFKKVLNVNPTDKKALEYISGSHFQQGLIVFGNEDYLAARDEFKASLEYNEDCEKCSEYIKKCEEKYMDVHYNKGVMYFRDEKLDEAIQEWELVSEIDPKYKDVDDNLKKSRKLLERLEKIKKSKMKD